MKLDTDAGKGEIREKRVGVAAVFDGHGGEEASEMASKLLMDYFLLHATFSSYKKMIASNEKEDDESRQTEILKEALLRTIHEIDQKFSEASLVFPPLHFKDTFPSNPSGFVCLLSGSSTKQYSCRIHSHHCCDDGWSSSSWECRRLKGSFMLRI